MMKKNLASFLSHLLNLITISLTFIVFRFACCYLQNIPNPEILFIKPGTKWGTLLQDLKAKNTIQTYDQFWIPFFFYNHHLNLQAGEYEIKPHMSFMELGYNLSHRIIYYRKFQILEGSKASEVLNLFNDSPYLEGPSLERALPEGQLIPNTYYYVRGEKREAFLKRLEKTQHKIIQNLWAERFPHTLLKTTKDFITLASILEKESGIHGERAHIASVYLNRLRIGMKLDADPTIIYAFHLLGKTLKTVTYEDLKLDHPYNTYKKNGLPPGPICYPSLTSLKAVLNPLLTQDLYFVADGQGKHRFSANFKDHQKNVQLYRQLRLDNESIFRLK
jgi:UPF0755 protein